MCPFVAVWPRRGTVPVPIVIEHATCIPAVGVVYGSMLVSGRSNERPYVRVLFLVLVVVADYKLVQQ